MKKALAIAGSDCSGGAGIQADLKTLPFGKGNGPTNHFYEFFKGENND